MSGMSGDLNNNLDLVKLNVVSEGDFVPHYGLWLNYKISNLNNICQSLITSS